MDSAFGSPFWGDGQEMLPRGVRGPGTENIVKGGFERETDHNAWLQHSERIGRHHNCLKRKGENVGSKKTVQQVTGEK